MTIPTFDCPGCRAVLRVRDRSWIGREIDCPECKTRLAILGLSEHGWDVRLAADLEVRTPAAATIAPAIVLAPLAGSQRSLSRGLGWLGDRPLVVAWLGAVLVAGVAVAVVVLQSRRAPVSLTSAAPVQPEPGPAARSDAQTAPVATEPAAAERLRSLAARVAAYVEQTGEFPAATDRTESRPPESDFSWLARLELQSAPNGLQPHPSTGWSDPANDGFVRRQIPGFLNPDLPEVIDAERRPVTHFVGIAGIGADAAELPPGHPRAGMFGASRRVRPEDLVDGASNTWMVSGVTGRLGSWAAAGDATVRSLTQEPYVNGPDGLGTGQPDAMLILLADGSVKTVSQSMDAVLLRRMASLSDGLPLDSTVPGDPAVQRPLTHDVRMELALHYDLESPPADALHPSTIVIPPARVFNLQAALAQPLQQFEQPQPVAARELLSVLEELLGAPIHGLQAPELASRLDKPLTVSLSETTVGDVLQHVLREIDLQSVIENNELRLKAAAE